jgi:hypothetical protein
MYRFNMKALTIKQPWLYAITDLTKRIENRSWKPPQWIIGKRIALHASKADDKGGANSIYQALGILVPKTLPRGCIVATATITGYVEESDDIWFSGSIGWTLTDIIKLDEPIFCKGQLGLWNYENSTNTTS